MPPGGYEIPSRTISTSVKESRRLSGSSIYERPIPIYRSPSPDQHRRYNTYDSYIPPQAGPSFRDDYPNIYRPNYLADRPNTLYGPPSTPDHYELSRHSDPDHPWDRSNWSSVGKGWSARRRPATPPPPPWDRGRRDEMMATRMFEPSDAWKQTHVDRFDHSEVLTPDRFADRRRRSHRPVTPDRLPRIDRSPPYYQRSDRYRPIGRDSGPNTRADMYRPQYGSRATLPTSRHSTESYRRDSLVDTYRPAFDHNHSGKRSPSLARTSTSLASSRSSSVSPSHRNSPGPDAECIRRTPSPLPPSFPDRRSSGPDPAQGSPARSQGSGSSLTSEDLRNLRRWIDASLQMDSPTKGTEKRFSLEPDQLHNPLTPSTQRSKLDKSRSSPVRSRSSSRSARNSIHEELSHFSHGLMETVPRSFPGTGTQIHSSPGPEQSHGSPTRSRCSSGSISTTELLGLERRLEEITRQPPSSRSSSISSTASSRRSIDLNPTTIPVKQVIMVTPQDPRERPSKTLSTGPRDSKQALPLGTRAVDEPPLQEADVDTSFTPTFSPVNINPSGVVLGGQLSASPPLRKDESNREVNIKQADCKTSLDKPPSAVLPYLDEPTPLQKDQASAEPKSPTNLESNPDRDHGISKSLTSPTTRNSITQQTMKIRSAGTPIVSKSITGPEPTTHGSINEVCVDIPSISEAKSNTEALRVVVMTRLLCDRQGRDERINPILMANSSLKRPLSFSRPSTTPEELLKEVTHGERHQSRMESFVLCKPALLKRFGDRQVALAEKTTRLREEYMELRERWLVHCTSLDEQARPNATESETVQASGRTTRRSTANLGDAVRSDLEMEQIIASLGNDELTDPNHLSMKNLAVVPDMISVTHGKVDYVYDDTNHLVLDPHEYYGPQTGIHDWTETEKRIFLAKFAAFPKQFGIISDYLPNKTAAQCVDYYYLHKKHLIDFRNVIAQNAPNKRRRRRTDKQKGNGLLADIRQHDAEIHRDSVISTAKGRASRRKPVVPGSVDGKRTNPRRTILQQELTPVSTPTPEPETRPRRRRAANFPASRVVASVGQEEGEEDRTDGEPRPSKRARRTRKPRTGIAVSEEGSVSLVEEAKSVDHVETSSRRKAAVVQWSEEDKKAFLSLLGQYGDDFKRIAASMPNKSTVQVSNYYKSNLVELDLERVAASAPKRSPTPTPSQSIQSQPLGSASGRGQFINSHTAVNSIGSEISPQPVWLTPELAKDSLEHSQPSTHASTPSNDLPTLMPYPTTSFTLGNRRDGPFSIAEPDRPILWAMTPNPLTGFPKRSVEAVDGSVRAKLPTLPPVTSVVLPQSQPPNANPATDGQSSGANSPNSWTRPQNPYPVFPLPDNTILHPTSALR